MDPIPEMNATTVKCYAQIRKGQFGLSIDVPEAAHKKLMDAIEAAKDDYNATNPQQLQALDGATLHLTLMTPQILPKEDKATIKRSFKKGDNVAATAEMLRKSGIACPQITLKLSEYHVAITHDKVSIYFSVSNQQEIATYVDNVCKAIGLEARHKDDVGRFFHVSIGNLGGHAGASVGDCNPKKDKKCPLNDKYETAVSEVPQGVAQRLGKTKRVARQGETPY
jgi:hypothetical protein